MQSKLHFSLSGLLAFLLIAAPVGAHQLSTPLPGKGVSLKTSRGPAKNKFKFKADRSNQILPVHDPRTEVAAVLVQAESGGQTLSSGLIALTPSLWTRKGSATTLKGYSYKDKAGTNGGITKMDWQIGKLSIQAKGDLWQLTPTEELDSLSVYVLIDQELHCTTFGGDIKRNSNGDFSAKNAQATPCADAICGNGITELGEECDDGNLSDLDTCTTGCLISDCGGAVFDSTFEAVQTVIFEGYGCTAPQCHGSAPGQGGLSLGAPNSYDNIVGVASTASIDGFDRIEPGEPARSFLYNKVAAATLSLPTGGGSPMPIGNAPLTPAHLEALERWIRGGAPQDEVVAGTAELLGTCLPDPAPVKIPAPAAPDAGVQLRQTEYPLPAQSEGEICMSTYYDVSALIPAEDQVSCASLGLDFGVNNPTGMCFRYHRQTLVQDPVSHHSIIHIYDGASTWNAGAWGSWTYKFDDDSNPNQGNGCNPTNVDPATGRNEGCSGSVVSNVGCLGYGPGDLTANGLAGGFSGSQEPFFQQEFADGVFDVLPVAGIVVWNSHAFNLTDTDTTMAQYLNLDLAGPSDQSDQVRAIFDASEIFVMSVPAFQTREYCNTFTLPSGANLFELNSHTHQWGNLFRIWAPPNTPCSPGQSACQPKVTAPIYLSTDYSDPLQLGFDPPITMSGSPANRTYLYCSQYDNGSTPASPPVKRGSTSVSGCAGRSCANAGPTQGNSCFNDTSCDSSPGAGDGDCDACRVNGGVTTTDEMFILLGAYY